MVTHNISSTLCLLAQAAGPTSPAFWQSAEFILATMGLLVSLAAFVVAWSAFRIADRAARNDELFQVKAWADEVIDLIAEAIGLCALDPSKDAIDMRKHDLTTRASALFDRGRFFFPNEFRQEFGTDKPGAYKGLRPQILDLMSLIHEMICAIDTESVDQNCPNRRDALVHVRRVFVSVMQQAVDILEAPSSIRAYERWLARIEVPEFSTSLRQFLPPEPSTGRLRFTAD